MKRFLYFDQAATSFPKAPGVAEAMQRLVQTCGCSINRGAYAPAYELQERVYETRKGLARLLGVQEPERVVFTLNATAALNLVIKGYLRAGDQVLVSSLEHNAVMRPLAQLQKLGVVVQKIPCDAQGRFDFPAFTSLCTERIRLVILTHASNVCGTIQPVEQVAHLCRERGIRLLVDGAQSAGILPISLDRWGVDAFAFAGHKGLLGPQGIGGLVLTESFARDLSPLVTGGTGSWSHTEETPDFLPDRLEPGTPNLPGILGLREAVLWLEEIGVHQIRTHEQRCVERFFEKTAALCRKGTLRIVGCNPGEERVGVVSVQTPGRDLAEVAWALEVQAGVLARVGMHCAPSAHRALGTSPEGTLRFSFGYWTQEDDIQILGRSLEEVLL